MGKTLDEFKVEAQAEIDAEKPLYAQVNNEKREFTESEYTQAVNDRANYNLMSKIMDISEQGKRHSQVLGIS